MKFIFMERTNGMYRKEIWVDVHEVYLIEASGDDHTKLYFKSGHTELVLGGYESITEQLADYLVPDMKGS